MTIQDYLMIIGDKEVTIYQLRSEVTLLANKVQSLTKALKEHEETSVQSADRCDRCGDKSDCICSDYPA